VTIFLALLSALAVVALAVVLIVSLARIVAALEHIGGESTAYDKRQSTLAKIAFGLRAIEQQTGHLGPEVTRLNGSLTAAAGGLGSIDAHLSGTIEAVVQQEYYR